MEDAKTDKIAFTLNIDPTIVADFEAMVADHTATCTQGDECISHTADGLIEELMITQIRGWRVYVANNYGRKKP